MAVPNLLMSQKERDTRFNRGQSYEPQVPIDDGTQTSFIPNGLGYMDMSNFGNMGSNNSPVSGFGMNLPTFNMAGNALGGLGKLAQGWAAIKGLGIAEDQMMQNQAQFDQNFGMQEKAYDANVLQTNNRINDQNAWKTAQGRTDLAQLVV